MTDLRNLPVGRQSVQLAAGATLYADVINFTDRAAKQGSAVGNVLLRLSPRARHAWLVEGAYAGTATFDIRNRHLVLADRPVLERRLMTQTATDDYTTFEIHWDGLNTQVTLRGPTRSDFSKSHPPPPGTLVFRKPIAPPPLPAPERERSLLRK